MGGQSFAVTTWNVSGQIDTGKRVSITERSKKMIRIEETEHEFLLYIPASQKERAKAIRPRDWDWRRVCWVYPRNSEIYRALKAEFGNDPTAKFAIAQPKFAVEQEERQRHSEDITSLRQQNSQLRAKVGMLSDENERLAADSVQTAARMANSLRDKEFENAELTRQLKRNSVKAATLSTERAKATNSLEDSLRKRESEIANLAEENSHLKEENRMLSGRVVQEAAEKKQLERNLAAATKKNESEIDELTSQNSRLSAENSELRTRMTNGERDSQQGGQVGGNVGNTDLNDRPNRKALSEAVDIYRDAMRPFLVRGLKRVPRSNLEATVRRSLLPRQADEFDRNLVRHRDLESAIDVNYFPKLVQNNWRDSFSFEFQGNSSIQSELRMICEARNAVSHPPTHDFRTDFTGAYLYHIGEVLGRIKAPEQKEAVSSIRAEWEESLMQNRLTH